MAFALLNHGVGVREHTGKPSLQLHLPRGTDDRKAEANLLGPARKRLPLILGNTEQLADNSRGIRLRELVHEFALSVVDEGID